MICVVYFIFKNPTTPQILPPQAYSFNQSMYKGPRPGLDIKVAPSVNTMVQTNRRSTKGRNMSAREDDLVLEMMITEARKMEEVRTRKKRTRLGIVKLEEPSQITFIKIEDSDEDS